MRVVGGKSIVKCEICEAPYRNPLTQGWSKTVSRILTTEYVMIHRPNCPAGMTIKQVAS